MSDAVERLLEEWDNMLSCLTRKCLASLEVALEVGSWVRCERGYFERGDSGMVDGREASVRLLL